MPSFVQYHNASKLGWLPLEGRPFLERRLGIVTRRPGVRNAVGATVYLIVGMGPARRKRFCLWERFEIESVREEEGAFCAEGPGWQLVPPQELWGPEFRSFQAACANFVGLRNIDDQPYLATLASLAERHRRDEVTEEAEAFATRLIEALPGAGDGHFARGFVRLRLGRPAQAVADLTEAIRRGTAHAERAGDLLAEARAAACR